MNVNLFRKREKKNYILLGVLLLLLIGVGYAAIGSNLNINGTAISKPQASTYKYRVSSDEVSIGYALTALTRISYNNANDAISAFGHNFLLRHKVENDGVTESYVGFVYNGNMYYIRGGNIHKIGESPTPIYEPNKATMLSAFGSDKCTDYTNYYNCYDSEAGLSVHADVYGNVDANDGSWGCYVNIHGNSYCYEKKNR